MARIEKMKNNIYNLVAQLEDEVRILKAQLDHAYGSVEKEWLRAIDNMPDGVMFRTARNIENKDLKLDYVSSRWEKMLGVTREESLADMGNLLKHIFPDDLKLFLQRIEESYDPLINFSVDMRYLHPVTKKDIWLQLSSYPRREGDFIYADGFIFDITDHKLAEIALQSEKTRLETLGNNLPNGSLFCLVLDTGTNQLRMEYVSATWEAVMGISAEETIADVEKSFAMIHPDDSAQVKQARAKSTQALTDMYIEFRIVVQNNIRWIQMSSRPHRNDTLIIWDGFCMDITFRKEAEQKLIDERRRLEAFPDIVIYRNALNTRTGQLRYAYLGPAWEEMMGVSAADIMNDFEAIFAVMHPEDVEVFKQSRADSAKTLTDFYVEFRIIVHDSLRWIRMSSRPHRENEMIVWDGYAINITRRKEIEHNLEFEKERLQMLGNNIPGGSLFRYVCETETGKSHFSFVSATWESVTGVSREQTMANPQIMFDIIHPDDLRPFRRAIDKSAQTLTPLAIEVRYVNLDEIRWMKMGANTYKQGTQVTWDGILLDITHSKKNEEELIRAKEQAEESDRLKSAFLANMSHEIRTPLNGIVGLVQLLDSDCLTSEERKEYTGVINSCSTQLINLIGDIVDISQIETKQLKLNPAFVQINNLMDELYFFFKTYMQINHKGNIVLMLNRSGFIDNHIVYVDSMRLRQVLSNLLNNAIKFTDKGHVRFGYRLLSPDKLEFMVEDSGIGMKPEHKDIIFERFRQIVLTKNRQHEGAGLGLSISRSLVQMMGGEMRVESTEGKGSTFYFTITTVLNF